jgi:hypothetical protein
MHLVSAINIIHIHIIAASLSIGSGITRFRPGHDPDFLFFYFFILYFPGQRLLAAALLLLYYCFTAALLLLYLLSKVEEHAKQGV